MLLAVVPEIAGGRRGQALIGFGLPAAAVTVDPGLLREVGGVSGVRPLVAVLRDFAVAVEVVEDDRLSRELVRVGRHVFAEQDQVGVAIAFAKIAEDLIVGAVFADDVKHVFDLRKDLFGDFVGVRLINVGFGIGKVRFDLRGVGRKLSLVRRVYDRKHAGERRTDVIVRFLRIG